MKPLSDTERLKLPSGGGSIDLSDHEVWGRTSVLEFARRIALLGTCALASGLLAGTSAEAQELELKRGFDVTLGVDPTAKELSTQSSLWSLEVSVKPMRMIWVDVTDPKTKQKKRTLVWYLIYKAVNRTLERKIDTSNTAPVNTQDPLPKRIFVPTITLVTDDNGVQRVYPDSIIPQAQSVIAKREHLPQLKNSVEIVGELPPATKAGSKNERPLYGIAMWQDVDATTDFFTVYMTGFSNGYVVRKGPGGKPLAWRRTIEQQFWRPGDRFDEREYEFRRRRPKSETQAKPEDEVKGRKTPEVDDGPRWIYRPDENSKPAEAGAEPQPSDA